MAGKQKTKNANDTIIQKTDINKKRVSKKTKNVDETWTPKVNMKKNRASKNDVIAEQNEIIIPLSDQIQSEREKEAKNAIVQKHKDTHKFLREFVNYAKTGDTSYDFKHGDETSDVTAAPNGNPVLQKYFIVSFKTLETIEKMITEKFKNKSIDV